MRTSVIYCSVRGHQSAFLLETFPKGVYKGPHLILALTARQLLPLAPSRFDLCCHISIVTHYRSLLQWCYSRFAHFLWGLQDFVIRCIFVAYEIGLKIGSRLLSIPHIGGQQICYQMNDFGFLRM